MLAPQPLTWSQSLKTPQTKKNIRNFVLFTAAIAFIATKGDVLIEQ
jgi:hypothetical protein